MKPQNLAQNGWARGTNILQGCTVSELFVLATIVVLLVGMFASAFR